MPALFLFRLIYDYVKVAFGLPTTGAAEPQKK
jgi:hypothetical protein